RAAFLTVSSPQQPAQDDPRRQECDAAAHAESTQRHRVRDEARSDCNRTLYDHPADSQPLGETGLLEERRRRLNLHGHVGNLAPSIGSDRRIAQAMSPLSPTQWVMKKSNSGPDEEP